jgi:RNA polymerase sigma-70 factor (ECF subfamily)
MKKISKDELFENIYDVYYDNVYKYIYSLVNNKENTQEIIAEVFTKIYKNIDEIIDLKHSKILVFNTVCDEINNFHSKSNNIISIEGFLGKFNPEKNFKKNSTDNEISNIKDIIVKFPKETKEMINMRYYGKLNFEEIAKVTNKTESLARATVAKGIKKITKTLYSVKLGKTNENI